MTRDNPRYVTMLILMTAAAVLSVAVRHGKAVPLRRNLEEFPLKIGNWQGVDQGRFPDEVMKVLRASDYTSRNYKRPDGAKLDFYIGYYRQQRAGESMHSPRNCLPGSGYEILEAKRVILDVPESHRKFEVNHFIVENDTSKQFVLYWYDTHGREFASEYEGKAILVWEGLKTGRTDGALIRVMMPIYGSATQAEQTSTEFARLVYPYLKEYLPE